MKQNGMRMSQKEENHLRKSRCDAEFCRSTSAPSEGHALFWEVEDANPSWLRSLPNHEVYEAMKTGLSMRAITLREGSVIGM